MLLDATQGDTYYSGYNIRVKPNARTLLVDTGDRKDFTKPVSGANIFDIKVAKAKGLKSQ